MTKRQQKQITIRNRLTSRLCFKTDREIAKHGLFSTERVGTMIIAKELKRQAYVFSKLRV